MAYMLHALPIYKLSKQYPWCTNEGHQQGLLSSVSDVQFDNLESLPKHDIHTTNIIEVNVACADYFMNVNVFG